jgi:hypothetical protein
MRRYDLKVPECSRLLGLPSSEVNGSGGGRVVKQRELVQKLQKSSMIGWRRVQVSLIVLG